MLTACQTCGQSSDEYRNCVNMGCQKLFIQCSTCQSTYHHTCGQQCQYVVQDSKLHSIIKKKGCRLTHRQRTQTHSPYNLLV